MNEEGGFIAALAAEPSDRTAALAFADWLDERGDPRGPLMRIDEVRLWMYPRYDDPLPRLRAAIETGKRVTQASQALALIGEAAVPGLVSLLAHKTAIIRMRAAKALRLMGLRAKDALPALLAMVKDPDRSVRREARLAAKEIAKSRAIETTQLREALRNEDAAVRRQAAALLGTMRAKRAVKNELAKGLDSPDPAERLAAVQAMASLRTKTAVDSLCKALADPSDKVRIAAAQQLRSLASPTMTAVVEPLRRALVDTSPAIRDSVVGALGKIGPAAAAAVPDLLRILPAAVGRERVDVVWAIVRIGVGLPEILDVVLAALRDPDEQVRYQARTALPGWKTVPQSALPAILEFVRDAVPSPNGGYRSPQYTLSVRAGLQALARIPGPPPEVWAALRAQLAGPDADLAAEVVQEIGPPAAVLLPELIAALSREGPQGRLGEIGRAIGRIGGEGITALVRALDHGPADGPNPVAAAAAAGLKAAGPAALPVLPALLDRLRRPMNPQVRASVVSAIAEMGPGASSAIPDLLALLDGDQLRDHGASVFNALEVFGPATVPFVPQLTELLRRPERAPSHAGIVRRLAGLIPHGVEVLRAFREALRQATAGDTYAAGNTPPAPVARAAIAGLAALGPAAAAAIPDLVLTYQTFVRYPPGDLREEVLDAYGRIGGPAVPLIRAAAADSIWKIRLAAIEALGATGDTSAETVAVLRAAGTDAARKVRARAAAVVKTMETRG
jgi:uncharacterized protein (TIGR02996 family)